MIDSSGLRFHYTKQLRKYESGILMVGANVNWAMVIPPRQKDWEINGFCSPDCTQKVLHLPIFAFQCSKDLACPTNL